MAKWFNWMAYIVGVAVLVYALEWYGIMGLLLFILGITLYRMWKMRKHLKLTMQQLEMVVWGKPLDRKLWAKDEMKNTRVQIVWGNRKDWGISYTSMLFWPGAVLCAVAVMLSKMWMLYVGLGMVMPEMIKKIVRAIRHGTKE